MDLEGGVEYDLMDEVVSTSLRVPLLFLIDAFMNGLPLCAFSSAVGYEHVLSGLDLDGLENGPSAASTSGPSSSAHQESVVVAAGNNASKPHIFFPSHISLFKAIFSWHAPCNALWDFVDIRLFFPLIILHMLIIFALVGLLMLNTKNLIKFYSWCLPFFVACTLIIQLLRDWMSPIQYLPSRNEAIDELVFRLLFGVVNCAIYHHLRICKYRHQHPFFSLIPLQLLLLNFFFPAVQYILILSSSSGVSGSEYWTSGNGVDILATFIAPILLFEGYTALFDALPESVDHIFESFTDFRHSWNNFGGAAVISEHWNRLYVPRLFFTHWMSRIALLTLFILIEPHVDSYESWTTFRSSVEYLVARGCESLIPLFGMTTLVSSSAAYVAGIFKTILEGKQNGLNVIANGEDGGGAGTVSGVIFIILAVQTGLTELRPEKRLLKLYRNLWLLSMALLHFVHSMTDKVLVKISSTGFYGWYWHARAVGVSLFLMIVPTFYIWVVWGHTKTWDPWLISVAVFAFEVILKVIVSLIAYSLFLMDTHWGGVRAIEDKIYYVRGLGAVLEFIFASILLVNGVWIVLFEQGGAVRSIMICIHAYSNIWLQAKHGWGSFKRRWRAAKSLRLLQTISQDEIDPDAQEVCSICYQRIDDLSADHAGEELKRTVCGHAFHLGCLRKWLYVQDSCPMCHTPVISKATSKRSRRRGGGGGGRQGNNGDDGINHHQNLDNENENDQPNNNNNNGNNNNPRRQRRRRRPNDDYADGNNDDDDNDSSSQQSDTEDDDDDETVYEETDDYDEQVMMMNDEDDESDDDDDDPIEMILENFIDF